MIGNKMAIPVKGFKQIVGNNVLIKQEAEPAEKKTNGGIIVIENPNKNKMFKIGHVVKVGNGELDKNGNRVPLDLKEGDKVMFATLSATPVSVSGEEYKLVSLPNIFVVIEED